MYVHELAQQTGVPTKTIRYYESIRLLLRPRRVANNYRHSFQPVFHGHAARNPLL
jgi:DNA-binding transcriptional MerR regulator